MEMEYIYLKLFASLVLFVGSVVTIFLGRRRQSPFYPLWASFIFAYGIFEVFDYLEFVFESIFWYRVFQISQSLAIILLFAACLEQSMILPSRSSRILAAALFATSFYFIVIPLKSMMESYKNITILLLNSIPTDIYGFWYSLLIIISAISLIPSVVALFKAAQAEKATRRPILRRNITILLILMLFGLAVITAIRREMSKKDIELFFYLDTIYSVVVASSIDVYQSLSLSHGVQALLLVDMEGNPLIGYSPKKRQEISYEEKIVAASGYLSGLFHFVRHYIAEGKEEQFRELKTTTSTLSFFVSKKFFLIVQSKIVSDMLEKLSVAILEQIDEYLKDLQVNEMPTGEQKKHIIELFDKHYNLLA